MFVSLCVNAKQGLYIALAVVLVKKKASLKPTAFFLITA